MIFWAVRSRAFGRIGMAGQLSKWFRAQGVKNGEWYGEVKAFMRRAAKASLTADAAAVLYILRLHTVAFRSEKAIKQVVVDEKTTRVPVTPADLILWTGLARQKVRDALAELEEKGFCARRAADGGKLRKGQVDIYCWTVPRAPKTVDQIVPPQGYKVFKKLNDIASIAEIRLPVGFVPSPGYISHIEKAYLEYKEATKVPQERLKEAFIVAPDAPTYKDERKTLKKGGDSTTKEQPAAPAAPVPPAESDVVVVSQRLGIRTSTGTAFVSACREVAPACTVQQIIAAIDAVDVTIDKRKYKNPTGILLEAVPPKLAADMKAAEEWKVANTATCWACHRPIYPDDMRMRGAHQACWDAEEAKESAGRARDND
jgi:hypothetical protein